MGNCLRNLVDDKLRLRPTKPSSPPAPADQRRSSSNYNINQNGKLRRGKSNGVGFRSKAHPVANANDKAAVEEISVAGNSTGAPPTGKIVTPNLKMFSLDELKRATRNFRPDTVLGEGGFGRVFKGWIDKNTFKPSKVGVGMPVAVKKSNPDSLQGLEEWQSEVKFLGKFSHPNLVKLIGYCWEENQFLLVYECMQKGSLENHLFRKGPEPLPWDIRLKIAIGAARGLAFLHTSEKSVIYRDFKSSNILLDGAYNAKLSDFGLAKLGPTNGQSHVTTRIMGTYGYAAPEYLATGHLYVKSDVYGFGVVLLELLTGLIALDRNRPMDEHNLVDSTKPFLSEKKKLKKKIDPRLGGEYSLTAAFQIAQLILKCIESDPKNRPAMEEVLGSLEKASGIQFKPKGKKRSTGHQAIRQSEEHSTSVSHYNHARGGSRFATHSPSHQR